MSWTKGQGVAAADQALASYQAQLRELESEHSSVTSDLGVIESELDAALAELARQLLPDTSAAGLEQAAAALAAPWLPERRRALEHERVGWVERLTRIEQDPQFVRRHELLAPDRGELFVRATTLDQQRRALQQEVAELETETFRWLSNRELLESVERGAFASFWDAVTLAGMRKRSAQERWAREVGCESHEQARARHASACASLQHTQLELDRVEHDRQRLHALLTEHVQLYGWTHDFEANVAVTLRGEVARVLRTCDLGLLHRSVAEPHRPLVARAHAICSKLEYGKHLQAFLAAQLADRRARMGPIQKTRLAWSMKPWEPIAGDKAQWLVALPQAKARSTHKQVSMVRRVHHNVVEYDRYDDYSHYLGGHVAFLAWDAFAHGANTAMPYEGFTQQLIPAIAEHRAEHGLERASFSEYRALDRQAEREALEHERAQPHDDPSEAEAADAGASAGYEAEAADPAADAGYETAAEADDLRDAEAGLSTSSDGGDMGDSS